MLDRFVKIIDQLTTSGDPDIRYRLRVNRDTIPSGPVRVIFTLFLDVVGGNLYLFTASGKSVLGLTAIQLRDELSVYTKAQVDSLLAGKANAGHTHGISLYTGTAGDPPHEHLVQSTTGIEQ